MSEPTTIHWITLPRNGNGGAALVTWRGTTDDSSINGNVWRTLSIDYLLGDKPPRYPVPAIQHHLDLIAAEPMLNWEDFKAIGFHGNPRRCCYT